MPVIQFCPNDACRPRAGTRTVIAGALGLAMFAILGSASRLAAQGSVAEGVDTVRDVAAGRDTVRDVAEGRDAEGRDEEILQSEAQPESSEADDMPRLSFPTHPDRPPPLSRPLANGGAFTLREIGVSFTLQPPPPAVRNVVQDLWKNYKVYVKGAGNDKNLLNRVHAAIRQFPAGEVGPLMIEMADKDVQVGILGYYWWDQRTQWGRIILYNREIFHVVLHEIAHHMTIAKRRDITFEVLGTVMPGTDRKIKISDIPSPYALTNDTEFIAEWVTHVRELQLGLPAEMGRNPDFKPDPLAVQRTMPLYAPTDS